MMRIFGTVLAGALGLAFGSFLNVCLSRWPHGQSIVQPRSHCRNCGHVLAWWENIPLLSWLLLRGRCRSCGTAIGWRYPLVELAVAALWAFSALRAIPSAFDSLPAALLLSALASAAAQMILLWLLVALAALDAENLWLPNFLTLPGMVLGLAIATAAEQWAYRFDMPPRPVAILLSRLLAIVVAAGLVLLIRWLYWLLRRREGIGMGDAKLMALLAAWLGLPGAILAFCMGAVLGAVASLALLTVPAARRGAESWASIKLPLGTFLCIGGIVSALCGQRIVDAYLRWAGF